MTRKLLCGVKISSFLFLSFFLFLGIVTAQEPSLFLPGTLSGEGTHFEITDSDYLNITLDSTEPIKIDLESIPEMIYFLIRPVSPTTLSAQITIKDLKPSTKYFKYEDSYHNLIAFTTDPNGSYSYIQDLTKLHLVFIQPRESTVFIKDDPTGGNCTTIGIWDFPNKICTLTTDVFSSIQIDDNGITLDGNNHSVIGTNTGFGIFLFVESNITIKNLTIRNFSNGMRLFIAGFLGSIQILNNNIFNNQGPGISLDVSRNTVINNNISTNNGVGIAFNGSTSNTITNNDASNNKQRGLSFNESGGNTISFNTFKENNVQDVNVFARFENSCPNTFLNNIGSGNRPIKYFSSSITLQNETLSSLILCNADGSLIDNVTIKGSDTLKNNGLFLVQTDNTTIRDVTSSDNEVGIFLNAFSNNNLLEDNTITSNFERGIILAGSDNNIIRDNLIVDSGFGLTLVSSDNNQIFNNNFIDNNIFQAVDAGGVGNVFNLPSPDGGNFWNDFDTPTEGCNDINNDRFCDTPFVFIGGQDNLPWTVQDGWKAPPMMINPTVGGRIKCKFECYIDAKTGRPHEGIDINRDLFLTPVKAAASGKVVQIDPDPAGKPGKWLWIDHGDITKLNGNIVPKISTRYLHLDTIEPTIIVGSQVTRGQAIGTVGNTGTLDAAHLHFETRQGDIAETPNFRDTTALDPEEFVEYITPLATLSVLLTSPADLVVADPDGLVVSKELNQLQGLANYFEAKFIGPSDDEALANYDLVEINQRKTGDYLITVVPEVDASPTDTYSVSITSAAVTTILAKDVLISDIPTQPYVIRSTETEVENIVPATLSIEPETLNVTSKGAFTAFVEIEKGFGASIQDVDLATIKLEGRTPVSIKLAGNKKIILQFKRQDFADLLVGDEVELVFTGKLFDETKIEGTDTIRVITKGMAGNLSSLLASINETLNQLVQLLGNWLSSNNFNL